MRALSQLDVLQQVKLSGQFPEMVEAIVTRQLIEQKAKALGLAASVSELQAAADRFRIEQHLTTVEQTVDWLRHYGLSLEDLETQMRFNVLSAKLAEHLFSAQVEPYFAEHLLDYEQAILYEIVLQNSDFALELFYAIQEQETTFTEIAHHYIQDPELRRKGGYLGSLKRADLKPEVSAAVFAASAPSLLKPISVGKNSHLILVEEVIHPQLDEALQAQILRDLFNDWLQKQLSHQDWPQLLAALIPNAAQPTS